MSAGSAMKIVEVDGRRLLFVKPAKHLFRSDMVHDVITGGRCFVVDMDTGLLEIYSKPIPKEPMYLLRLPGGQEIPLSTSFPVAEKQIHEMVFSNGWAAGEYIVVRNAKVYNYCPSGGMSYKEWLKNVAKLIYKSA